MEGTDLGGPPVPTSPARVQELFLAALDLPDAAARAAHLDAACARDPELRARVEALLRAHATPDSLLDAPVVPAPGGDALTRTLTPGTAADAPADPDVGEGFELGEEIGRGANGVVPRPPARAEPRGGAQDGAGLLASVARARSSRRAFSSG